MLRFFVAVLALTAMAFQIASADEIRHTEFLGTMLGTWAPSSDQCATNAKSKVVIEMTKYHTAADVYKRQGEGRLEIGPLANLPVIKDLATDMARFFEKWQDAKGVFAPSKTRHDAIEEIKPESPARRAADADIIVVVGAP